jgi:hypothetical protein
VHYSRMPSPTRLFIGALSAGAAAIVLLAGGVAHRGRVWAESEPGRLRVVGDTVFAVGAVLLVAFVAALATGHAYRRSPGA